MSAPSKKSEMSPRPALIFATIFLAVGTTSLILTVYNTVTGQFGVSFYGQAVMAAVFIGASAAYFRMWRKVGRREKAASGSFRS